MWLDEKGSHCTLHTIKNDVFKALKGIKNTIPETLYILPSNIYEVWAGLTAWIKKGDLKK